MGHTICLPICFFIRLCTTFFSSIALTVAAVCLRASVEDVVSEQKGELTVIAVNSSVLNSGELICLARSCEHQRKGVSTPGHAIVPSTRLPAYIGGL